MLVEPYVVDPPQSVLQHAIVYHRVCARNQSPSTTRFVSRVTKQFLQQCVCTEHALLLCEHST